MRISHKFLMIFAPCAVFAFEATAQQPVDSSSANNSQAATTSTSSRDGADTPDKKTKKVWTEDDVHKLGGVSVVGDSKSNSKNRASTGSGSKGSAANYKQQLDKLQAQLDDTNKKLAELQNFNGDNAPDTAINPSKRYNRTSIADQIKQLEDKKKQLGEQIQNVFDQARRNGIEPGALR